MVIKLHFLLGVCIMFMAARVSAAKLPPKYSSELVQAVLNSNLDGDENETKALKLTSDTNNESTVSSRSWLVLKVVLGGIGVLILGYLLYHCFMICYCFCCFFWALHNGDLA